MNYKKQTNKEKKKFWDEAGLWDNLKETVLLFVPQSISKLETTSEFTCPNYVWRADNCQSGMCCLDLFTCDGKSEMERLRKHRSQMNEMINPIRNQTSSGLKYSGCHSFVFAFLTFLPVKSEELSCGSLNVDYPPLNNIATPSDENICCDREQEQD